MDDTPGRVSGTDMAGRASEDVASRSTESMRGYDASDSGQSGAIEDSQPDTARIRRDIDETREEMSETIDAIQEKLRPANIVSNATDTIKHATTERVRQMTHSAGQAASSMLYGSRHRSGGFMEGVRENPFPVALIGVGAAWLLMSSRSSRDNDGWNGDYDRDELGRGDRSGTRSYGEGSYREDVRSAGGAYGAGYSGSGYSRSRSAYDVEHEEPSTGLLDRVTSNPVPAALAGIGLAWLAFADTDDHRDEDYRDDSRRWTAAGDDRQSMMAQASDTVSGAASSVSETAGEVTDQARDYARDATRRVRRTGRRAQNELQRMTRENPLAVGAGALLLGALVGLAIPESERENEWLGETRDSLVDKAQQMAKDATNRAQDAAADLVTDAASKIVSGTSE